MSGAFRFSQQLPKLQTAGLFWPHRPAIQASAKQPGTKFTVHLKPYHFAMPTARRLAWKLPTALLLLSLVPIVAGAARLSQLMSRGAATPENARFIATPAPVVLHIVSASLFCVLGAFQFDPRLRQRFPRLHRITGRVAAPCGVVAGLTGVWMTAVSAIPAALQGPLLYGVRMLAGLAMTLAVFASIAAVLQRRFVTHRAWMIRAYALGQGAGTQVLILLPVALLAGEPTFLFRDLLMASAWGLNMVFAEWLIRYRLPFT
jgi:uncharacterized membrane protein